MDVDINIDPNNMKIDCIMLQKMIFIHNALEKGWAIKKKNRVYVFTKNHEGKKEVMLEDYLRRFMLDNLDISKIK
uniref:Uncharacterized protein n=1 Tax=viral metagenome TaxID=1070528 RepID=A0A6C0J8U0_9ZZZZ|tara:strand:- start:1419 stop:1643 length:225 start_codon:yes stop_codon:yes gene_type:complete